MVGKLKFVTEETYEARIAVCKTCEKFIPGVMMCRMCGCLMAIKGRLQGQDCPLHKWPEPKKEETKE